MMNRLRPGAPATLMPTATDSFTGRKKVTLTPGHSLMDWIRLGRTKGDLTGLHGEKHAVTPAELALHNTPKDIWMAIRGKVYNITPYMEYHPGGTDELMRAAGKDGTELFDEVHNWVNVESMMEKCYIGPLVGSDYRKFKQPARPRQTSVVSTVAKPPYPSPTFTWHQSGKDIIVEVKTEWKQIRREFVIVDLTEDKQLALQVFIAGFAYFVHMKLSHPVNENIATVVVDNGKVKVTLQKEDHSISWSSLGEPLGLHEAYPRKKNLECRYKPWMVESNTELTHDTKLLSFRAPEGYFMQPPIGRHIHIKKAISGMEIARSYTTVVSSLTTPSEEPDWEAGKLIYLMVKSYPGGALSPWVTGLRPGERVMLSEFEGTFETSRLDMITHLVCFAAGTGFTSMIRVLKYALFELNKATFPITLVFFNKKIKDILWRTQLDDLAKSNSRFSVTYVLSQEMESEWAGLRGRVTADHIQQFVPKPSKTVKPLLMICGQWAYNDIVENLARIQGLEDEHIHIFSHST